MSESKRDRIKNWLDDKESPIWNMQLQPTDRCNLNCKFCWRQEYTREMDELSKDKWLNIVEEACKMGVKMITFVGGGEPTIRSDVILEASSIMGNFDVEGAIVTNGTLFTNEMIKKLVQRKWEGIAFSINGAYAETDDFLRGMEGTFRKTIESIQLFNKWKERENSIYPKLTIQMVITRHNYDQILPMYILAKEMKIDIVLYRMVNEGGDMEREFYIENGMLEEIESQLEKIKTHSKDEDVEVKQEFRIDDIKKVLNEDLANKEGEEAKEVFENQKKEKRKIPCAKPFSEMVILADGTSHPCCVIAESKYKDDQYDMKEIENIKNKTLSKLWKGDKMCRLRETMQEGNLPKRCKEYCTLDMIYREKSGAVYEDKW